MKKAIIFLLSLFCIYSNIYSQKKEVSILSPKASSIMKYGEHPVSLYTGLVDITIPIYTIERSGVKVPIEFKYHASGIKYDDISNEVGLGWSLIAGGMITRSVKGDWDGQSQSYSKDITKILTCSDASSLLDNDYIALREVENGSRGRLSRDNALGEKDGEIDMYSFSFLNHSGSFCFPPSESEVNGSIRPAMGLFIPNDGMKVIDRSLPNQRFDLLDMDGVYYRFEVKDEDQNTHYKEYYLTKIISMDKSDTINFTYDVVSAFSYYQSRPYINYSATFIKKTSHDDRGSHLDPGDVVSENGGLSFQELRPPRLKRIDFRGGHIDFEYAVKNGITTWDLKEVRVYNNTQSSPIQTVTLTKSLFSNGEQRLDKVIFTDSQTQSYEYQLSYNGEPCDFHNNISSYEKGIDYWGYPNGQIVPYAKRYIPKFNNMPYGMEGIDRNANESYLHKGVLNKIIYPTKGYTEFTYEAHRASYSATDVYAQTLGGLRIKEIRNYLPDGTLTQKKWYKYGYNESGTGVTNKFPPDINDFLTKTLVLVTFEDMGRWIPQHLCQSKNISTYSSFPRVDYFISGSPVVYPEVTEYVGNNSIDYGKTIYNYNITLDEKFNRYGETFRWDSPNTPLRNYSWKTGKLLSKQVYKKEGTAYKEVYSLKNLYKDINTAEFRNVRVLPYAEFEYDMTSQTKPDIKRTFCENSYKHYRDLFMSGSYPVTSPYDYFNYYTTTGLQVLESTDETIDGVTTSTTYETYNNVGLPTTVVSISSAGDSLTTAYKYTTDSQMISNNILTPITGKTILKKKLPLMEESDSYNYFYSRFFALAYFKTSIGYMGQLNSTGNAQTRFEYYPKGMIKEIFKDESYRTSYIWGYNRLYPIAEIRNANYSDITSKIPEATLNTIAEKNEPTASDWSLIEGLRTSLPDTQISTYTYKPLIGMLTATDHRGVTTYYEYDSFGRLKETYIIENGVKKVVQVNDYHYQNQ